MTEYRLPRTGSLQQLRLDVVFAFGVASLALVALFLLATPLAAADAVPTDNPVATYYDGPEGYSAWTDRIRWSNVIDMSKYERGKTDFERFEAARDELAAAGGGVLYYPAGTYDFSDGPFDGPRGRGLMLRSGVVIRGEAPSGKPRAVDGAMELPTRFIFGFTRRDKDIVPAPPGVVSRPETPRDWNLIGLMPEPGKGLRDVENVGICWVHFVGAIVFFGADNEWGETWRTAGSWKSDYVKDSWADRVPDGTHPWDPLAGGGNVHVGSGSGRLVFGCVLQDAVGVNNSITMGRPDTPAGFGPAGFYMGKFIPRISITGSRVFVANTRLAKSTGRNFKYRQRTRYTYPGGKGNSMAFGDESMKTVLFDYNKAAGIDVNKAFVSLTGNRRPEEARRQGFFREGVVIRDNWVYNHGHKGFNVSGTWVTIQSNRNERDFLEEGKDPYGIGDWELTLDGYLQSAPGGNGAISDNLSRGFDLAGQHLWIDHNTMNSTGSSPGNDGEAILCQAHGGTQLYCWAITHNRHERGNGQKAYFGGWNVEMYGALLAWNKTAGWVGGVMFPQPPADLAFVANQAAEGTRGPDNAVMKSPGGPLRAPLDVQVRAYENDAVRITWRDAADNEIGFRVDRRINGGPWATIAYRPPRIEGSRYNPPQWIDFTAPRGRPLVYRVVAIDESDSDAGASEPTVDVTLQ